MDLTLKTAPTLTSIDVTLVKEQKRIRHGSEDNLILQHIRAADEYIEKATNRAMMKQTFILRVGRLQPIIELPRPPLLNIVSVKFTPDGGAEETYDHTDKIRVGKMVSTISTGLKDAAGAMIVEYEAGYDAPAKVPPLLRQASLLLASHYHTSREAAFMDPRIMNVVKTIPFGVDQICAKFRVPNGDYMNGGF